MAFRSQLGCLFPLGLSLIPTMCGQGPPLGAQGTKVTRESKQTGSPTSLGDKDCLIFTVGSPDCHIIRMSGSNNTDDSKHSVNVSSVSGAVLSVAPEAGTLPLTIRPRVWLRRWEALELGPKAWQSVVGAALDH